MKKLNLDLKVSEKDKMLLMILIAFGILAASYFFGFQKLTDMTQKYQNETTVLRTKQKDLIQKNKDKDKYISDTEKYKNEYNVTLSNYANGTAQDASLDFLNKVEMITGTWIKSTTLSDTTQIFTFGDVPSTNPSNAGSKVYSTDMKGYKTTLTLTYEAKYSDWKKLIDYVNNYYSKNSIDTIAMSYNDVTGLVSGTMALSTYAITGSQRPFISPKFNLPTGTDNIFSSDIFNSKKVDNADQNGEYILSNYDYFITLNAATSDVDSCIIGKKNNKESTISSNSNATEKVEVKLTGSSGNYKIQYKIGNITFPAKDYENGVSFEPGNTIDLLLISSSRVSASDKSGISLNLINESDMPFNVKVYNDDIENPRVIYESKTGNVIVYK